jgi:hypothetical protein
VFSSENRLDCNSERQLMIRTIWVHSGMLPDGMLLEIRAATSVSWSMTAVVRPTGGRVQHCQKESWSGCVSIFDVTKIAHEVQIPWRSSHKGRISSSLAYSTLSDIFSINAASWMCAADMATILAQSPRQRGRMSRTSGRRRR